MSSPPIPDWPPSLGPPIRLEDHLDELEGHGSFDRIGNASRKAQENLENFLKRDKEMQIGRFKEIQASARINLERLNMLHIDKRISTEDYNKARQEMIDLDIKIAGIEDRLGEDFDRIIRAELESIEIIAGGIQTFISADESAKIRKIVEDAEEAWVSQTEVEREANQIEYNLLREQRHIFDVADRMRELSSYKHLTEEQKMELEELNRDVDKSMPLLKKFKAQKEIVQDKLVGLKKIIQKADSIIQEGKGFKESNAALNFIIRGVSKSIASYTDPIMKSARSLSRSAKLIAAGFESIAQDFVIGAEESKFLQLVNDMTAKEVEADTARTLDQVKRLNEIVKAGTSTEIMTAEIAAEMATWMSPSWKLRFSIYKDFEEFVEFLKNAPTLAKLLSPIAMVGVLASSFLKVGLGLIWKAIERLVSIEKAVAIARTIEVIGVTSGDIMTAVFAPEIQAIIFAGYAFFDMFRAFNWQQFGDDLLQFVDCGLINIDGLKMHEYPDYSKIVSPDNTKGPDKMWELDHREIKTIIDFWGALFLKAVAALDEKPAHPYKPYANFAGVKKIPGKYIRLGMHPWESQEHVDRCTQLETELDLGELVDQRGYVTGLDKGGHLVSNIFPRKKDTVRNFVDFPLYNKTIAWPKQSGIFSQTEGNFVEKSIDPEIVKLWKFWVETGAYGEAFRSDKATAETKRKQMVTNKRDFHAFMFPSMKDPFIWTIIKDWAKGNAGKRGIISQEMHQVTLNVLKKEQVTDYPRNPYDKNVIDLFKTYPDQYTTHEQDTIQFVEVFKKATGRYPYTPAAQKFYNNVIHNRIVKYWHKTTALYFTDYILKKRKATEAEVNKYHMVVNEIENYMTALEKTQGDINKAWSIAFKEELFKQYVKDTSPRTMWGYISLHKTVFITELQAQVNIMMATDKAKIWQQFLKLVAKVGVPLNTNRFHRLSFMGKMNRLVYLDSIPKKRAIENEIERVVGKIVENKLITSTKGVAEAWAHELRTIDIINLQKPDWPVFFGDIHCRIIVTMREFATCFVIFRSTSPVFEYIIDGDFIGAEYGTIEKKDKETFSLNLIKPKGIVSKKWFEKFIYSDSDNFALHQGFTRVWKYFKSDVTKTLTEIYKKYPIEYCMVSGYALGGAIAQIACLELPSNPVKKSTDSKLTQFQLLNRLQKPPSTPIEFRRPHLYVFASPAVGDVRFVWHLNNMTRESAHVFVDGDVGTMIPPFLIPAKSTWGDNFFTETVREVAAISDIGASSTTWLLIGKAFKSAHLPFDPMAWRTGGKLDWTKISNSLFNLNIARANHQAYVGGGIHMRLEGGGTFEESATDPGSSAAGFAALTTAMRDMTKLKDRHNLDTIASQMDEIALKHPDLFEAIDKEEFPQWGDAGTHAHISPKPPQLAQPLPKRAKIIGIARTVHTHMPHTILSVDDLRKNSFVRIPDQDELKRKHQQQRKRYLKRKSMEGEYHGY